MQASNRPHRSLQSWTELSIPERLTPGVVGLDQEHDTVRTPLVGLADVLVREPVDDLPGRGALEALDHAAADAGHRERVVVGRHGDGHARVALEVARLARPG